MSLSIKAQAATSGDPRKDEIWPMPIKTQGDPDKPIPDFMCLLGMLCSMAAMLLKIKPLCWVALVFLLSSLSKAGTQYDYKMAIQTLMFTVFGMASSYILPMYQRSKLGKEYADVAAWLEANP